MPVRDLLVLLRRQGEALGPNSWNGTRLAKRASERFREIDVIKSRTNRFIWPAAVEGTKSRFVRFKTKDDLLNPEPNFRSPIWFGVKQVGTALVPADGLLQIAHHHQASVQRRDLLHVKIEALEVLVEVHAFLHHRTSRSIDRRGVVHI